jgi:hypothetical protein
MEVKAGISAGTFVMPAANGNNPKAWYRLYLQAVDATGLAKTIYQDFVLKPENAATQLVIFPVPVHDKLNLDLRRINAGSFTVEIYSAIGKLIVTKEVSTSDNNKIVELETSALINGVYVIRVSGEKVIGTLKFIKE